MESEKWKMEEMDTYTPQSLGFETSIPNEVKKIIIYFQVTKVKEHLERPQVKLLDNVSS